MDQVLPAWFREQGDVVMWHRTMEKDAPRIALCDKPLQQVFEFDLPKKEERCSNCEDFMLELQSGDKAKREPPFPKWE